MDERTQQTLLVAQVLTLAKTLELQATVQDKKVITDWEREAAKLINRRSAAVLQLLTETL